MNIRFRHYVFDLWDDSPYLEHLPPMEKFSLLLRVSLTASRLAAVVGDSTPTNHIESAARMVTYVEPRLTDDSGGCIGWTRLLQGRWLCQI